MSSIFRKLIKHTVIISSGTFISRILGFLRDVLIAKFFGTSYIIEAFMVAFRLPNMFRSLLGEGAVDSVVIPVISEHKKNEEFSRVGSDLLLSSFSVLLVVVILGTVFAKYIVAAIAPGFLNDPQKFTLTVRVTRIIFSYLLFVGLSANLGGILYSKNKFFVPSFSPIILNVIVVGGLLFVMGKGEISVYYLSYFVLLAGLLQFIWHFVYAKRYFKVRYNFKAAFKNPSIRRMFKLSLPRIWSVAVYHINVFIDTFLASFAFLAGGGAIAAIYYSNRLIQFPLALFSLGISRAALPKLSSYRAENDFENFKSTLNFSFKNLAFFIIPFSVLFLVLSNPIVEVVFKRGQFSDYSVNITSSALFFYAFGLFFFSAVRLFISIFYSLKDTKTPAKVASGALVVNVILSVILMRYLKVGGLALASSLSSCGAFFVFLFLLQRRIGKIDRKVWKEISKILIASIFMGVLVKTVWSNFEIDNIFFRFGVSLLSGLFVFFIAGAILKLELILKSLESIWYKLRRS